MIPKMTLVDLLDCVSKYEETPNRLDTCELFIVQPSGNSSSPVTESFTVSGNASKFLRAIIYRQLELAGSPVLPDTELIFRIRISTVSPSNSIHQDGSLSQST